MPYHSINLNGSWQVRAESLTCRDADGYQYICKATDGWLEARVPGEIHLDLIRAGLMPEPSVGNNAPQCRWPETKSWWFRTSFEVTAELPAHERVKLVFDGLDLYAQVFVNGHFVGEAANAFIPVAFEVKSLLQIGANELVVRLTAGSELARDDTPAGQGQVECKPYVRRPTARSPIPRARATCMGTAPGPARNGCAKPSSRMGGTG